MPFLRNIRYIVLRSKEEVANGRMGREASATNEAKTG
jgi:hypothetical protein